MSAKDDAWMRFVAIRFPDRYRPRPDARDFALGLLGVIDRARDEAHAANGGPGPRCLDQGHEFLCRFPAGSCLFGMCNEEVAA